MEVKFPTAVIASAAVDAFGANGEPSFDQNFEVKRPTTNHPRRIRTQFTTGRHFFVPPVAAPPPVAWVCTADLG